MSAKKGSVGRNFYSTKMHIDCFSSKDFVSITENITEKKAVEQLNVRMYAMYRLLAAKREHDIIARISVTH